MVQQSKIFYSKIGPGIVALTVVPLLILLVAISYSHDWYAFTVLLFVTVFILHLFGTTKYTISDNELRVQSGFLVNTKIDINTITSVADTHTLLSSPALSMDRIEINYNKYDTVIISPKDKAEFIHALLQVSNGIVVNVKDVS